jgi:hypothetical protein
MRLHKHTRNNVDHKPDVLPAVVVPDPDALSADRSDPQLPSTEQPPAFGHDFAEVPVIKVQAKLTVSTPSDPLEEDADRMANRVLAMRAPEPDALAKDGDQSTGTSIDSGRPEIQSSGESKVATVLGSGGEPLDTGSRRYMQSRFAHDFSNVRVHTGDAASRSAGSINANAYTLGHDIVFGANKYAPGTTEGDRLLAHELTHVVQQNQVGSSAEQSSPAAKLSGVIFRQPATTAAAPSQANTIEFPDVDTDKASDEAATAQAEANRRAAQKNAPVFQINNVEDRTSAQEAINLLKKVEPMLRLGAQQALNKGKTVLNPGNTEKDDFEGYLKDNNLALGALEGYQGSAQTQAVALSTFQLLHQQTIAEFGRLDGKMKALLGSSLAAPDDNRAADRMGKEDAQALAAGGDLTKQLEEAKTRDPKLADAMKALENQRQQMEIETDGLSTDSNNVTNKFRGITTGLTKVSGAAARMSSVELKAEADAYKETADQKKAQVDLVVGAVLEGIKAIPEGPAAAGKAVGGKVAAGVWEQVIKPHLDKWYQGGEKLFGKFPNNLDSLAKTDEEKAAVQDLRAGQAAVADANRDLQTAVEQLEQKVKKVLVTKQAYGEKMREIGDRIDKASSNAGNAHAFREVMGLISEGERFVSQATETIQVGEQELTQTEKAGQGGTVKSSAKEAHDQMSSINAGGGMRVWMPYEFQVTEVEIKDGKAVEKPRLGPDGQPVKIILASRSSIKVLTAQNKAENFQDVPKFGSAESGQDASGNANTGVNATVAVTLDQVKDMKGKVSDYVTALRVNSIGGGGAANPNN